MKPPKPPIIAPIMADCLGTFGPTPTLSEVPTIIVIEFEPFSVLTLVAVAAAVLRQLNILTDCPSKRVARSPYSCKCCPILPVEVADCKPGNGCPQQLCCAYVRP